MKLKLMTYNIASCRDYHFGLNFRPVTRDFAPYIDAICKFDADICGLNEVDYKLPRSCRVKMAKMLGDANGYESAFAPAVTWGVGTYGNGFLSKFHIKESAAYPIPNPEVKNEDKYYEPRVILHALVDMGGRDVDVFVTHFGLANGEKEKAAETLTALIKFSKNPVILMGDFNMHPDNPLFDPIRELLTDTFEVYPNQEEITCPSGPNISNDYEKIDYIFVSRHFKVESVEIPNFLLSDHKPYIAYVELLDEETEG